MSPDVAAASGRRRRWPGVLLAAAVLLLVVLWIVLPIRYFGDVRVEGARVLEPGQPDGSRKEPPLATPRRIAVTFSAPVDLAAARAEEGLGYLAARLSACDGGAGDTLEVITQRAEYLGDYGRVRALGPSSVAPARPRYRVVFDDRLTRDDRGESRHVAALDVPGGLCFSLYGASMWFGYGWSNKVLLRLPVS